MKKLSFLAALLLILATLFGCSAKADVREQQETQQGENQDHTAYTENNLPETVTITMTLEGMQEERQGYLNKSENGFGIYLIQGYYMDESDDEADKTDVVMDYDKEIYAEVTVLKEDTDLDDRVQEIKNNLQGFGEIIDLDPKDHFDPYFQDAQKYIVASSTTEGSIIILMKRTQGHLLQYEMRMPMKEAAEGAGPALWAMLKTIQFYN